MKFLLPLLALKLFGDAKKGFESGAIVTSQSNRRECDDAGAMIWSHVII